MKETKETDVMIKIEPLQMETIAIPVKNLLGSPLVQNRFSEKARMQMQQTHEAGQTAKSRKVKAPRDFEKECKQAAHISKEGWYGIPCTAFKNSMVDACRVTGYVMTTAKQAFFILPDGVGVDGEALVKIIGDPHTDIRAVRNSGAGAKADLRARPMFEDWSATVNIRFNSKMLTQTDIANLLEAAGLSCGLLEGRPSSKMSKGLGWGMFEIEKGESND